MQVLEFCETRWKPIRAGNGASNGKSMILANQHCGGSGIERRRRAKPVIAVKDSSLLHSLSPPTFNLATASTMTTTTTTKTTMRATSVHYAHVFVFPLFSLFFSFLFFLLYGDEKVELQKVERFHRGSFFLVARGQTARKFEKRGDECAVVARIPLPPSTIFVVNLQVFPRNSVMNLLENGVDRAM